MVPTSVIYKFILFLVLIQFGNAAMAQKRRDPSYSVHNYKHPNKAAEAKAEGYDDLQKLDYTDVKGTTHRNYKAQNQSPAQEGAVVPQQPVEKAKNSVFSRRNYKR